MNAPVIYDLSRLLLRSFGAGPNGIDRVDLNLGRYFLGVGQGQNRGLLLNRLRPAAIGNRAAVALLDIVESAWHENLNLADDQTFQELRRRLLRAPALPAGNVQTRMVAAPASRVATALRIAPVLLPQLAMLRPVPKDSIFIHTTQFPTEPLFRWLDRRPDVKPVFFVHDLLPITHPKFFTAENVDWHRRFLQIFLRYGRAAIVNTEAVKNDLAAFLKARSSGDKPILALPMPASPLFARAAPPDAELRARPYFVICGTIEPRKNHLFLLKVWQQLVRIDPTNAPKLVIIGNRGWNNTRVFDLLDHALWTRSNIIEVGGLTSIGMKHIVANARALLMPSLAEGYGLPIVEALAIGTPVIASDIVIFREIGDERISYCALDDTASWLNAIRARTLAEQKNSQTAGAESENKTAWEKYFRNIDTFINGI